MGRRSPVAGSGCPRRSDGGAARTGAARVSASTPAATTADSHLARRRGHVDRLRIVDATASDIDAAARIWAAATAARDREASTPPVALARTLIESVATSSTRSFVVVAVTQDGQVVGFAAAEPAAGRESTAEVRYVGVSPSAWGGGVGTQLMRALPERLKAGGFTRAQLMVYVDNQRATQLYERLGWRPNGDPAPHPRSGKLEQRYTLELEP